MASGSKAGGDSPLRSNAPSPVAASAPSATASIESFRREVSNKIIKQAMRNLRSAPASKSATPKGRRRDTPFEMSSSSSATTSVSEISSKKSSKIGDVIAKETIAPAVKWQPKSRPGGSKDPVGQSKLSRMRSVTSSESGMSSESESPSASPAPTAGGDASASQSPSAKDGPKKKATSIIPTVDAVQFRQRDVIVTCPHCDQPITTELHYKNGTCVWMTFPFLFCIPLIMKQFKNVIHRCPKCKKTVAVYERYGKKSVASKSNSPAGKESRTPASEDRTPSSKK